METQFSVLMSIYVKENPLYLEECLESIFNQTVLPFEVIMVKDGKLTAQLEEVLSRYAEKYKILKVVSLEKNVGLGKSLETGLLYCSTELIARMDTDDICKRNRFEKQLACFVENPRIAVVGSNVAEFSDNIKEVHSIKKMPISNAEIKKYAKKRNPFNHPTVMFKKSVINEAEGYQDMPLFEDYYLWLRVLNNGHEGLNIDEELVSMRANDDMYKRRGGFSYFKKAWIFRKRIYKLGYNSILDLLVVMFIQFVNALVPNFFRAYMYKKILRN